MPSIKKKLPFRKFRLNGGTYEHDVEIIVTQDLARAVRYINREFSLPDEDHSAYTIQELLRVKGKRFRKLGLVPIIWMPRIPRTLIDSVTVSHELLHVTFDILDWIGVTYSRDSEEAFCHLQSHLETQLYDKLAKK